MDTIIKSSLLFCSCLMVLVPGLCAALDITVLNPSKIIKRDLGPLMTLSTPNTTVKTPITISSFPPGWEHGKVHALAVVYFFETSGSSTDDIVGYGGTKKSSHLQASPRYRFKWICRSMSWPGKPDSTPEGIPLPEILPMPGQSLFTRVPVSLKIRCAPEAGDKLVYQFQQHDGRAWRATGRPAFSGTAGRFKTVRSRLSHPACAVLLIDAQTAEAVEFNEQAHRALGYSREEFKSLSLADIEIEESPEEIQRHMKNLLQQGEDTFETRHRAKDGRILFVDDEPMIRKLGKRLLERQGYEVETQANGPDALECFKQDSNRFDLVVADMTMPGMRGDQLARHLMAIGPDVPVILATGYSKQISEEEAKEIGIRALVMKPVTARHMANVVRGVLDEA